MARWLKWLLITKRIYKEHLWIKTWMSLASWSRRLFVIMATQGCQLTTTSSPSTWNLESICYFGQKSEREHWIGGKGEIFPCLALGIFGETLSFGSGICFCCLEQFPAAAGVQGNRSHATVNQQVLVRDLLRLYVRNVYWKSLDWHLENMGDQRFTDCSDGGSAHIPKALLVTHGSNLTHGLTSSNDSHH